MAIPSRQIGWSTTANLLWQISKQLEYLNCVAAGGCGPTTTTTTTFAGTNYNVAGCERMEYHVITYLGEGVLPESTIVNNATPECWYIIDVTTNPADVGTITYVWPTLGECQFCIDSHTTTTTTTAVPTSLFDVTADWTLTTPDVVDEITFRQFLEVGNDTFGNTNTLTDVVITDFLLVAGRLTCNLSAAGKVLSLGGIDVSSINAIGNIVGLIVVKANTNAITSVDSVIFPDTLQILDLKNNKIVIFNPTIPLPIGLTTLDLSINLMTRAGYIASLPWATAMTVVSGRGTIVFTGNASITGTSLESTLVSAGWTVIP